MGKYASGDHSGQNPTWYWTRGLHDALILRTEAIDLSYDHTRRNPVRSCFQIHLDASTAMFDTSVQCIKLLNYKILLDDSAHGGYEGGGIEGCYWMQDILKFENGKYILEITALGEDDFKFIVRFDDAQVERI